MQSKPVQKPHVTVVPHNATPQTQHVTVDALPTQQQVNTVQVVSMPPTYKDGWDRAGVYVNTSLAVFAALAFIVTLLALAASRKSTAIANKALLATLRPKLIVRKITMTRGTLVSTLGVPDAHPWTVDFDIANVGQGVACVINHAFFIRRFEADVRPDELVYVGGGEPFELAPGEDTRMSFKTPEELKFYLRMLSSDGLSQGWQNTDRIYFFGGILYADELGVKRNTVVCRHYKNARRRFEAVDDPDREYAD